MLRKMTIKSNQKRTHFRYDYDKVLTSSFHMDANRAIDRFFRFQRVLRNRIQWQRLDFESKRVLEIGCGPLLGWAPIALYLGCDRYFCVEPALRENFVYRSEMLTRFYLPMHRQLEAQLLAGILFDDFINRLRERTELHLTRFEDFERPAAPFDLIVSQGVLQHVSDLSRFFQNVQRLCHTQTRHFHVVHFNDHYSPPDRPFDAIYSVSPDQYLNSCSLLNLKRPSEISELFERHKLAVEMVPYYRVEELKTGDLCPYWKRFDQDDLSVVVAFFIR